MLFCRANKGHHIPKHFMINVFDINCDMGEGYGSYSFGNDAQLLPYLNSVNIACGFHAGDPTTIRRTISESLRYPVLIGAHPGYPDLTGFGRRPMVIPFSELVDIILYQISALFGLVHTEGGKLHHVKPHGALYTMASVEQSIAAAIIEAIRLFNPTLVLYAQANSVLYCEANKSGLRVCAEGFIDRAYSSPTTLQPRTEEGSVYTSQDKVLQQVQELLYQRQITCADGTVYPLEVQTICIHGDNPKAVEFARAVKTFLEQQKT